MKKNEEKKRGFSSIPESSQPAQPTVRSLGTRYSLMKTVRLFTPFSSHKLQLNTPPHGKDVKMDDGPAFHHSSQRGAARGDAG